MQAPYAASATRYDNSNNYHNSMSKHLPSIRMQMVFSYATWGVGEGGGQTNLRYKRQKSFDAAAAFFRYLLNAKRKLLCNDKASRGDIWRQ